MEISYPIRPIRTIASKPLVSDVKPPEPQVRKRNHHDKAEWEFIMRESIKLYTEYEFSAEAVVDILRKEHGFSTSVRKLHLEFRKSGIEKKKGRPRKKVTSLTATLPIQRTAVCPVVEDTVQVPRSPGSFSPFIRHHSPPDLGDVQPMERTRSSSAACQIAYNCSTSISARAVKLRNPVEFESLPWGSFSKGWYHAVLNAIRPQNCRSSSLGRVTSSFDILEPLLLASKFGANYAQSDVLTQVHQVLLSKMPEQSNSAEHLLRAQSLITCPKDHASIVTTLEVFLYFISNNINLQELYSGNVENPKQTDEILVQITDSFLLQNEGLLKALLASTGPIAIALIDRIFAAAIRLSRINLLERLEKVGLRINTLVNRNIAVAYFHGDIIRAFGFGRRFGPGILPIHLSLLQSNIELYQFLIDHGANINAPVNSSPRGGNTSLEAAAAPFRDQCKEKMVEILFKNPDIAIAEDEILRALENLKEVPDENEVSNYLFSHIRNTKHLIYPSRVLIYAIRYSQHDLITSIMSTPRKNESEDWTDDPKAMWEAMRLGDYNTCELLLNSGLSPNLKSRSIPSALHIAIYYGSIEIIELLLQRGSEIDFFYAQDFTGSGRFDSIHEISYPSGTPLTWAIIRFRDEAAHRLLRMGASCGISHLISALQREYLPSFIPSMLVHPSVDLTYSTVYGETILAYSIIWNHEALTAHLLELRSLVYDPVALFAAVYVAIQTKRTDLVHHLLSHRKNSRDIQDEWKFPESLALVTSVYFGDQDMLILLTQEGLGFSENLGEFFRYAATNSHQYLGKFDIQKHSRSTSISPRQPHEIIHHSGWTLLGVAYRRTHHEISNFLIGTGHQLAPFDFHDILFRVSESDFIEILKDPHHAKCVFNSLGTILISAIESCSNTVFQFLLERHGIESFLKFDLLPAASGAGHIEMVKLLIESGAKINHPHRSIRCTTPLQRAALIGSFGIAKLLMEHGAECNTLLERDHQRTALEGAAEHGHIDLIHLLLKSDTKVDGEYRYHYLRAVKFAERECHFAAAKLLRDYCAWTPEDLSIFDEI